MRRKYLFPFLLITSLTMHLHAQAKLAIYGTVGAEKTEVGNEGWIQEGTFRIFYGLLNAGPIAIAVDARGDLSDNINSGLFGPRVAFHAPLFPLKPYVELLGGFSSYSSTNNGAKNT